MAPTAASPAASLTVIALNCTLKPSGKPSSTDRLLEQVLVELKGQGVMPEGGVVRVADLDIKPGVTSDEGEGDDWPALRRRILDADILLIGTPIWLGQPSSVCKRVLERMDAFLDETDGQSRMPSFGKVAAVCVVGNEDGAHHVHAELYQALNDVGFTLPAVAGTYWVGEAMQGTDYKDLDETPEAVAATNAMLARHAAHLARLLKGKGYPGAPE
ncbi:flavodoxin family protein [Azospirillum picis]|uniref:Multimeric flavodoxin WrbA n=1 Tax=Azospirillum picis TaxID=488438 RepID=A0ABU0MI99_9PROT|nr:flavodoxin family protein [Azospirillum picis]MBP2299177.1 multimeric flavodoxin WrbA [Azospirillum picis]MDQ0533185.1 multimeric flavodoxin WrbA [Azospirillum picis]